MQPWNGSYLVKERLRSYAGEKIQWRDKEQETAIWSGSTSDTIMADRASINKSLVCYMITSFSGLLSMPRLIRVLI